MIARLRRPAAGLAAVGTASYIYLRDADQQYKSIPESSLPQTYDPAAIATVWNQHPKCVVSRLATIARRAAPFAAKLLADAAMPPADADAKHALQRERAVEARALLTDLGPTFIKFGQMLSIRPDVLPPPAVYELQKLCDSVPSYPTPHALELIESELGQPASELFDQLAAETEPIAAASLGQVYKCTLKSSGEQIALKVQRPDMIRAVSLDLHLLRTYMHVVEWFKKRVLTGLFGAADRQSFDVNLLDTFARASYLELDYRHEAENLNRFAKELVPRCGGKVYVPKCHQEVTTRKVLATEWIDGEQLAKSPPHVINKLIPTGVACFLAQLLDVGFFHSDPHPGNLLVDKQGRLVLIDFGLCAEIKAFDTRHLTSAIVNLMRADVDALVDDAVTLRFLPPDVDRDALLPPLRKVFARGRLAAASVAKSGSSGKVQYGAMEAKRAQFAAVSRDLNQIFFEFPFTVPEYFALITRALIVLEGIALVGDKDFDLFQAAYPLAAAHASRLFGTKELATMLGEAARAERGLRELAADASAATPLPTRQDRFGLKRTLTAKAWC